MPSLIINKLVKSFASKPVIIDASFSMDRGESVIISGENGSGKSTLLKIISTIMKPDSGTAIFDGLDIVNSSDLIKKRLGYMSHQSFLYEDMSVWENLNYFEKLAGVKKEESEITSLLDLFAINEYKNIKIKNLSHGTQKKITLCRCLLRHNDLLVLDEPDTGLDIASLDTLRRLIDNLNSTGVTIMVVTHNKEFGNSLKGRNLVLKNGVLQEG